MKVRTITLTAAVAALASGVVAQSPPGIIEIGKPFPTLELPRLSDGELTSVGSLIKGKKTVLLIFASW